LQEAIPASNVWPVRVFSQDERHFGLLTLRRRRLTARGVQPVGPIQHVFQWFSVYSAVAPTTGEHFFLELPYLNADNFQIFVDGFAQAYPDSLNILLLDKSGGHTGQRLTLPDKEARAKTQRHQVTAWGAQAEVAQQRLEKGTRVQIVGRIDQ